MIHWLAIYAFIASISALVDAGNFSRVRIACRALLWPLRLAWWLAWPR